MAKGKTSFILYSDIIHTVEQLPDEKAGELFKHILAYVNDENPVSTDPLINIAFEPIKQSFKRDLIKWDGIRESRSKAGKASAEKRKQKQQVLTSVESVQQTSTNPTVSVSVSVSDSVSDSVIDINNIYPSFLNFWDAYDKKVGDKEKIKKKWDSLSQTIKLQILEHIDKYKAAQPDKQYRLNPQTFLNQKGWENEIITNKNNLNGKQATSKLAAILRATE